MTASGGQRGWRLARAVGGVCAVMVLLGGRRPPVAYPLALAPEEVAPQAARGDAVLTELQTRLGARLKDALGKGPPEAAITVCKDAAPAVATELSQKNRMKVGRTSFRLRNPANAPPAWAKDYAQHQEGKRAADVQTMVFDLGTSVGVLRPIPTAAACIMCHGMPAAISPAVLDALKAQYPKDKATGFAEGELRGFMWAEVAKSL